MTKNKKWEIVRLESQRRYFKNKIRMAKAQGTDYTHDAAELRHINAKLQKLYYE